MVLPVNALDTKGSCVPHSCISQVCYLVPPSYVHVCASCTITWASQYILATHISSVLSLLWLCALALNGFLPAAGVPQASCENLPQLLACVPQAHL